MLEVYVKTETTFKITLPIDSFDEILFKNMPEDESDEMIYKLVYLKHKVMLDKILEVRPVK